MTPSVFYELVLMLCQTYHGSITSGYRTAKRNASPRVKGHVNSRHKLGLAFDVVLDDRGVWGAAFMADCKRQGLKCTLEDKGKPNEHYHCQSK